MRPNRFALVFLFLLAVPLFALDVPPAPAQWFTDRAGVVGTTDADILNSKLRNFEQETGAQFIIYVFPSLEGESIEDFTIRCVEKWKVGQKKYDNGLVLFVFVQDKLARIEVGYGLEGTITDAISSRVIRENLAPYFKQQQYGQGLNSAADALMARIRKGEPAVPAQQQQGGQRASEPIFDPQFVIFLLFVFFVFVLPMILRGRRRGGGGCGGCLLPLIFSGGGTTFGGGGGGFGGGFGGGGGGFSGGGGSFGGGGATGGW